MAKKPSSKPDPKSSSKAKSKAAPKPEGKNPGGRPTDYREQYAEQARKLCLLGATDKELAAFFCVAESTLNLWKIKVPEFSESLRAGKEKADAEVAQKLFDRATGAQWVEQQAFKVKIGKGVEEVKIVNVIKAAPPDTPAIALWLQNRRPDLWRKTSTSPPDPGNVPEDYQKPLNPDEPAPNDPIL